MGNAEVFVSFLANPLKCCSKHVTLNQRVSRRNPVARRQGGKLHSAVEEECVAGDEQGIKPLERKSGKGRIDLADCTGVEDLGLQPDGGGGFLHAPQRGLGDGGIARIDQHGNTNSLRH